MNNQRDNKNLQKNPVKAIKAFCFECCGENRNEVKLCTSVKCALYPFRLGVNPYRTKVVRNLTDEQKAEAAERMKRAREAKK